MATQTPPDFRSVLEKAYRERCDKNSRYSLRAFARDLKVEPSALSKILRGQRRLTPSMQTQFAANLGLPRTKSGTLPTQRIWARYLPVTADAFAPMSDWYIPAAIELQLVEGFTLDEKWIARALGLTAKQASRATRYLNTSMAQKAALGASGPGAGGTQTSVAMRRLQRQILLKAIWALANVPVEERSQSSMTMAIRRSQLPLAREKIKTFRREMSALLKAEHDNDDVYQLSVSFFPLTSKPQHRKQP